MDITKEAQKGAVATTASAFFPVGFSEGSRIVTVKWSKTKHALLPNKKEVRAEFTKSVGSGFKKGTRDILRGLRRDVLYVNAEGQEQLVNEEKLYLPDVIGNNFGSNEWESVVKEYWANFNVRVHMDGTDLEIGFNRNGTPINVDDYAKYKFLCESNQVASSREDRDNKDTFEFYIVDKNEENAAKVEKFKFNTEATKLYLSLVETQNVEDKAKIDYILELIGGEDGDGIRVEKLDELRKQMELERTKNEFTVEFMRLAKDRNLATKALIRRGVNTTAITREGNAYFILDQRIGSTEMEAVAWLDDPNNGGIKEKLISRIKAAVQ